VTTNTADPAVVFSLPTIEKRRLRRKTVLGFEVFGLIFLAVVFTAAQFGWLLETGKA
jgi:hypothetical protein